MKPAIRSLRLHQQVWAVVEEIIAGNEIIINFGGDLIRVSNQTNKVLRPGQRVLTSVQEIHPLKLKLVTKDFYGSSNLDIQV